MNRATNTSFGDLPDELILLLLRKMVARDVAMMDRVCKRFHRICEEESIWRQFCVELANVNELPKEHESFRSYYAALAVQLGPVKFPEGVKLPRGLEVRVVVLGSGGVGKSSTVVRYVQNIWVPKYDPTIEDSYRTEKTFAGTPVTLEILDTAGTERFTAMRDLYMKNGHAFIYMYSIIAKSTVNDAADSIEQTLRVKDIDPEKLPFVIVGNKLDLEDERVVPVEDGRNLAARYKGAHLEASAKAPTNVDKIFDMLMLEVINKNKDVLGMRKTHKKRCIMM